MQSNKEFVFKVLLVGDAGVGKSSILASYLENDFKKDYSVTIGVEFGSKTIEIDPQNKVKLQIWDTAGQESFRSIVRSFYRNAAGIFITYSVCNKESFKNLEGWVSEIRENAESKAVLTLIGNKSDKHEEREVTFEEGKQFSEYNGLDFFFETSAYTKENINKCFQVTTKSIFDSYIEQQLQRPSNIGLIKQELSKSINLADRKNSCSKLTTTSFYNNNNNLNNNYNDTLGTSGKKPKKACC